MRQAMTMLVTLLAAPAGAADLRVVVEGLRSTEGQILVAVCPEASFTTAECPHTARAPAAAGEVVVTDVPPGSYAVQAIHDENGNGDLDRRFGLLPQEGIGFSRDAPMRRGPPSFGDAAIDLRGDGTISLAMRYFQ